MTAIILPTHLETWAEAEVAAGRAESIESLTVKAIEGYRRAMDAFRKTLEDASAEAKAGLVIPLEQVVAELEALYPDEA
jgi:predicted transcriptional regulator